MRIKITVTDENDRQVFEHIVDRPGVKELTQMIAFGAILEAELESYSLDIPIEYRSKCKVVGQVIED